MITRKQIDKLFSSFFESHGWETVNDMMLLAHKTYPTYHNPTQAIVYLQRNNQDNSYWIAADYISNAHDNPLKNCGREVPATSEEAALSVMKLFLENIQTQIDNTPARKWLANFSGL